MAAQSSIEWTEATWNPVTGCSKVSTGCLNCYAERMAKRLQAMGQKNYARGFELTLQPQALGLPLTWKKPQIVFVNSMSDLFHERVPTDFILSVFDVMSRAHWHQFQILTKRADRLLDLDGKLPWVENVWVGVTIESAEYLERAECLRQISASTRFLSLEPLLGPLTNLELGGIDWVIVGGESGPGARPMAEDWVLEIRDKCLDCDVPFFFKQWGGVNKKRNGRMLQGKTWSQQPVGSAANYASA